MWSQRAREGICLLLNNDCDGAQLIFEDETDDLEMATGKCFVQFITALLSYEPDKLEEAVDGLRDIERRCSRDTGWLKSVKSRIFGSNLSLADADLTDKLQEQIILADSQVCIALLTFLQQDISSIIKGGWKLRKAWNVYQTTYSFILDLYNKTFPAHPVTGSEFPVARCVSQSASSEYLSHSDWSVHNSSSQSAGVPRSKSQSGLGTSSQPGLVRSSLSYLSSLVFAPSVPENSIPAEVVARLMTAVSFGFGIFQLCVSLVPPSLLRVVHLLGFEGDRQMALDALMFARNGDNMRGPLARLALLWFHTIVRPFLALDGANVKAGVDIASQLYEESKEEFSESALFLFFLGRIHRLRGKIPESLKAYESAIEKSRQKEVELLCLHEVGWCYLILLDWSSAHLCFDKFREKSRWSKPFYTYLTAVSVGASGDVERASALVQKIPKYLPKSSESRTTIEAFIARRVHRLTEPITQKKCTFLCLELLYLWNTLPSTNAQAILKECEDSTDEPMIGMCSFLQGVVHTSMGDLDKAERCYRNTLLLRQHILADPNEPDNNDNHISAFTILELATLLISAPHTVEEGRRLLNEARDKFKGYDFENKATIRIHAALKI